MSFEIQLGPKPGKSEEFADYMMPAEQAVSGSFDVRSKAELEALVESLEGAGHALWPRLPNGHLDTLLTGRKR
jgi:hypothetical protein